jgi:hypothetical protein
MDVTQCFASRLWNTINLETAWDIVHSQAFYSYSKSFLSNSFSVGRHILPQTLKNELNIHFQRNYAFKIKVKIKECILTKTNVQKRSKAVTKLMRCDRKGCIHSFIHKFEEGSP